MVDCDILKGKCCLTCVSYFYVLPDDPEMKS